MLLAAASTARYPVGVPAAPACVSLFVRATRSGREGEREGCVERRD